MKRADTFLGSGEMYAKITSQTDEQQKGFKKWKKVTVYFFIAFIVQPKYNRNTCVQSNMGLAWLF